MAKEAKAPKEAKEAKAPKEAADSKAIPCAYAGETPVGVCDRGGIKAEACAVCGKAECKPLYYKPAE